MGLRAWHHWLRTTLGRRGATLLFFGILDVCQSGALLIVPGEATQGTGVLVFPDWGWSVLWGVAGVACLVCAFLPPGRDATGFAAAIGIKMLWGAAFLVEAIWGPAPWLVAVVGITWWLFAIHAFICAGWAEASIWRKGEP
jgi:hypothetical protein